VIGDMLDYFDFGLIGFALAFIVGPWKLESSKNRLNLEANRPLLGLGEAGDRQWRSSPDFSMLRIG
jgi:hypothetical protein